MAWHAIQNFDPDSAGPFTYPDRAGANWWCLKEAIKAANPTGIAGSGWSIAGSGDGLAAYELHDSDTGTYSTSDNDADGHYDILDTIGAWSENAGARVANRWGNQGAWLYIRSETGVGILILRRLSGESYNGGFGNYGTIILSPSDGFDFSVANATTPPGAAADERLLVGTRTTTSNAWGTSYNDPKYHHAAVNDSPVSGEYGLYCFATDQSTMNEDGGCFLFDPCSEPVAGDPMPWVVGFAGSLYLDFNSYPSSRYADNTNATKAFRDYGGGSELWTDVDTHGGLFVGNQVDGDARHLTVMWGHEASGTWKGFSSVLRFVADNGRSYPDTLNLTTANARVYAGAFTLPWEQNVTPL